MSAIHENTTIIPFDVNDLSLWLEREMGPEVIVRSDTWKAKISQLVARLFGRVHCIQSTGAVIYLDREMVRAWREKHKNYILKSESEIEAFKSVTQMDVADRKEISRHIVKQFHAYQNFQQMFPVDQRTQPTYDQKLLSNPEAIRKVVNSLLTVGKSSGNITEENLKKFFPATWQVEPTRRDFIDNVTLAPKETGEPLLIKELRQMQEYCFKTNNMNSSPQGDSFLGGFFT